MIKKDLSEFTEGILFKNKSLWHLYALDNAEPPIQTIDVDDIVMVLSKPIYLYNNFIIRLIVMTQNEMVGNLYNSVFNIRNDIMML